MHKTRYRFRNHPGDLFRNDEYQKLPDPQTEKEDFLIAFLSNYQSDDRVAYLDDLYKCLYDEFTGESEELEFANTANMKDKNIVLTEIKQLETILINEAYWNFYELIKLCKIELL